MKPFFFLFCSNRRRQSVLGETLNDAQHSVISTYIYVYILFLYTYTTVCV